MVCVQITLAPGEGFRFASWRDGPGGTIAPAGIYYPIPDVFHRPHRDPHDPPGLESTYLQFLT